LWTSPDERWSFKKGMKCGWTSKKFQLLEGLSHKFLGPYAGPFKVLENKLSDIYKWELSKNLRVHPTFHVSILKPVFCDALRLNRKHNSRPPWTWFIMNQSLKWRPCSNQGNYEDESENILLSGKDTIQ
jgi:hypothetical protein